MFKYGFQFLATVVLLLSTSGFAHATYAVKLMLVRAANTDGTHASALTAEKFALILPTLNQIYQPAGISFTFDPKYDYPAEVVKDDLVNYDMKVKYADELNNDEAHPPKIETIAYTAAKNKIAQKYPDHLVVIAAEGNELKFNDVTKKWDIIPRDYDYSNGKDDFVAISGGNYDPGGTTVAHEIGHFFHLSHPFSFFKTYDLFKAWVASQVKAGISDADILKALDGDSNSVSDTPPDAGNAIFKDAYGAGQDCGNHDKVIVITPDAQNVNHVITVQPDRLNIMSYFKHCVFAEPFHFSPEQKDRIRVAIENGNRQRLLNNSNKIWQQVPLTIGNMTFARFEAFAVGVDASIKYAAYGTNFQWYPGAAEALSWVNLGGFTLGQPSVVSTHVDTIDIVTRGIDNQAYRKFWDGSNWMPSQLGWQGLGGIFTSDLATASPCDKCIFIFGKGTDNALYWKAYLPGAGWVPSLTGWTSLGGNFYGSPVAISSTPLTIDVFALSQQRTLMHIRFQNAQFGEWQDLGGNFTETPEVIKQLYGKIDLVGRSSSKQIYHKTRIDPAVNAWLPSQNTWEFLGGSSLERPTVSSDDNRRFDIFVHHGGGGIAQKTWMNDAWYPQSGTGWKPFAANAVGKVSVGRFDFGNYRILIQDAEGRYLDKACHYLGSAGAPNDQCYPDASLSEWSTVGRYID